MDRAFFQTDCFNVMLWTVQLGLYCSC